MTAIALHLNYHSLPSAAFGSISQIGGSAAGFPLNDEGEINLSRDNMTDGRTGTKTCTHMFSRCPLLDW